MNIEIDIIEFSNGSTQFVFFFQKLKQISLFKYENL